MSSQEIVTVLKSFNTEEIYQLLHNRTRLTPLKHPYKYLSKYFLKLIRDNYISNIPQIDGIGKSENRAP